MSKTTMDWTKLEELAFKSEQLANMALALFDAMYEGPNHPSTFEGAMNLFTNLSLEYSKEMNAFFNEAHAVLVAKNGGTA